uniref:Lysine-specific demethylase n=1 Tax=Malurus cyaneus samueli TaxID=2593467 RepID=A0A8C5X3K4_9PASS
MHWGSIPGHCPLPVPRCPRRPSQPEVLVKPWQGQQSPHGVATPWDALLGFSHSPPIPACRVHWMGARPHGADFSMDTGPGRPSEPKDERLGYQSVQAGSPPGCGEPNPSPLLADGHYPAALAKPEPPPGCLCPTAGCDGCPGVGCGVPNPFEPTLAVPGGRFPCPPSNHTKLKKTWLTRHSEQSLPRSKVSRRDGGPEPPGEGKRSAKRPHGTADGPRAAGEGAGAAKRGTKATVCPGDEPPSRAGEPWCLQSLPCTALPQSVPRCCACAPRAGGDPEGKEEEDEEPPESTCRLSLCLAKYLLGVLGDPFCDAVRRDRDTWPGAPGGPEGAPQLCDACQRGFFNSHWSCARCGFQLCPDCHRSRREDNGTGMGTGRGGKGGASPGGIGGDKRDLSLTQRVQLLTRLWKLLHEVRAKFGIESHCPCGEGTAERSLEETPGGQVRGGSPEEGPPSPGQPPARGGAVQTTTLCDLLASTAVKLCLGQDGVRMAFAPVAPALPNDNRLTSILDSIIARVVERKIQERQAGGELSPPSPPDPPASHCVLAPSGLLWLHDPGHASNYKLFQEHWRQGQPVLVSGLQKRLEARLWGPESFQRSGEEEVEAVNLRAPGNRVRISSREFWDGFAASTGEGTRSLWGPRVILGSGLKAASLPLPEYCGASGRLNLATYLRGQRGRRWLRPRVRVAYGECGTGVSGGTGGPPARAGARGSPTAPIPLPGVRPQDRNIGTKNLTVEAADSISVLPL